ncbi:phage tail protein, partial [Laribacter hongkongensis]
MPATYYCLLTRVGEAKLAKATALGTRLAITHLAVGDGGGSVPQPEPAQTALKREVRRGLVNELKVDPLNANQIIIEQVIPEEAGGWWIREVGAFDADGDLIAVGNCPESYKPVLAEGSGRTQVIRMVLIVSSTDAITLKVDPSVVLATKQHVTETVAKAVSDHVKQPDPHPQYATDEDLAGKLGKTETAADSEKLGGRPPAHYLELANSTGNLDLTGSRKMISTLSSRARVVTDLVQYRGWSSETGAVAFVAPPGDSVMTALEIASFEYGGGSNPKSM